MIDSPLLHAILLGAAPVSEVRGAVIYALGINEPWLIAPAALANVLVAVVMIALWGLIPIERIGRFIIGKRLHAKLEEASRKYEHYGVLGLALFIGIPLPVTGVYTGVLVGKILGLPTRVILLASVIGVAFSATVSFLIVSGALAVI